MSETAPPTAPDYYEAAKRFVGCEERMSLGTISRLQFQRFAHASGDLNPLYFDPEAARGAGYADVIAPPVFLTAVLGWGAGPAEADLKPDGTAVADTAFIELPGARLMGGGQELELVQPVEDGDDVTMHRRVVDVKRRAARSGDLVLIETERRYTNQHGELLVICRETVIVR